MANQIKIKVVLLDKEGKELRFVEYPKFNALKLLKRKGWELPKDSPYKLKGNDLVLKKAKSESEKN